MDANANPEKASGASEPAAHPSNISAKSAANNDIPTIESPKLVPEQGEQAESVKATAKAVPVTALVIASPRIDGTARAGAAGAREKFKAFTRDWRLPKVSQLAATIMIAASVGAVAGSLGTFGVSLALKPSTVPQIAEIRTLKDTITHLRADLSGLKAGAEASTKAASAQLARMAERLDKAERAEKHRLAMTPAPTPPATIPAVQSPVAVNTSSATNEATGSIPTPRPSPLGFAKDNSRPPVIQGWVLRNVYDGTAYIQSQEGQIEVQVGDGLPDGGRVEAIRRENGRWIVFTTRGLVVMR